MTQRVFRQIAEIPADIDITIATAESQAASIEQQLSGEAFTLVLEPERRDTMPAIMLACANLRDEQAADADDTVIVMPIDTFAGQEYYDSVISLNETVQSGFADLVLLGVSPTHPSEKYGYIVPVDGNALSRGSASLVSRFAEKPSQDTALELINEGALWNCGVFAFKLEYLLDLIGEVAPRFTFAQLQDHYGILSKTSFDYGVVEQARSVAVVRYNGTWKDLGTWNTLSEEMAEVASGRAILDEGSCVNTHVINETGLPMVVAGLKDAIVVATHDGILVSSKEKSAQIKKLIEIVKESRPMYEKRQWGEYRVLDMNIYPDGKRALTKELVIEPGKQLSYQRHKSRSEVWTVVSGIGSIVIDDLISPISSGSVVSISAGVRHAIYAETEIHIIEVQMGDMLEEDDIERYGYFWKVGTYA